MRLKGKAALVTGAGQGFGYGIAEAFVREGARVACLDVKGEVAEAAAKRLGPSAMALKGDVSNRADIERAARAAIDALGRIDIVVNNAGTTHRNKPIMEVEEAEFDRIFAVNVKSIFLDRAGLHSAYARSWRRRLHQCRLDRGSAPAPGPHRLQRLEGRGACDDEVDGGRACAGQDPRLRARSRRRRDAAARHVHGRGHAGEARRLQGDGAARPVFDAPGHRSARRSFSPATRRTS